jgi:hypothetical protein
MSVSLTLSIAGADAAKLKKRITEEAMRQGMSISEYVVMCVAEHLRKENS